MKSRERVLTTLRHKEPDRVPIDLGSTSVTGISAVTYRRLKEHLAITEGDIYLFDIMQQLAIVEEPVRKEIGVDAVSVIPKLSRRGLIRRWKPGRLTDGTPCKVPEGFNPEELPNGSLVIRNEEGVILSRLPPDGIYFDDVYAPLQAAQTIEDIERYGWPYELDPRLLQTLKERSHYLLQHTDYAVVSTWAGSVYETAQRLRRWDTFMMDLAGNAKFAGYLMDKLVEVHIERFRQYIDAVGDRVHVIIVGDDLGMETGPQLSPDLYRKMVKPRQRRLWSYLKGQSNAYLFLHSCGSVYPLIPDFIEMGLDILNPVQVAARDMDSARLKREFGKDIVFWGGGCDTQHVLPFGTPQEVRQEVRRRIEDFAPGGGFVFSQVHNIQPGVPLENLEAMYEAAEEFGGY